MTDALATYIRDLVEAAAESASRDQADESRRLQAEAEQFAQRAMPLIDRVKRIIATLPETERNKPRPLEFFAVRLRGRKNLSPHRGELAAALRTLGWTRRRCWRQSEAAFRAYWHAPVND